MAIILDIGSTHHFELERALKSIEQASYAGADYVKFQLCRQENLNLPIDRKWIPRLLDECKNFNIRFLCSVWSLDDARLLLDQGVDSIKLAYSAQDLLYHIKDMGWAKIFCTSDLLHRGYDDIDWLWTYTVSGQPQYPVEVCVDWDYISHRWHGVSWHGCPTRLPNGFDNYEWHCGFESDTPDGKFAASWSTSKQVIERLKGV